jgi:hypothetical protein
MVNLLSLVMFTLLALSGGASQDTQKKSGQTDEWVFHEILLPLPRAGDVCFSICTYKGDSGTKYIGMADKDDDSCTNACGEARKKCKNNDDAPCTYQKCTYSSC